MKIFGKEISTKKQPFIIAEISANHNNSMTRTLKLIKEAKKVGANAIKLQTYTADTITIDSDKNALVAGPISVDSDQTLTIKGNMSIV